MRLAVHPSSKKTPKLVLLEALDGANGIESLCICHLAKDGAYVLSLSEDMDAGDAHILGALLQEEALAMARGHEEVNE